MSIFHFYQLCEANHSLKKKVDSILDGKLVDISCEVCYNVAVDRELWCEKHLKTLQYVLKLFSKDTSLLLEQSHLVRDGDRTLLIEVGPRLNQRTPFCTNATSVCDIVGLKAIHGIERSFRYKLTSDSLISEEDENEIAGQLHDPMTECRYEKPLQSLCSESKCSPWYVIDVLKERSKALQTASDKLGLAFDEWDISFYAHLFRHELKRNPTSVECFDLAQSNSEHSRHWFFKGKMIINGKEKQKSLFKMVQDTLHHSNCNNKIAFHDNGSAIEGSVVEELTVKLPGTASEITTLHRYKHLTLTAETHNFPTGVAPFPGAATGTGGRQRDQHAIGQGSSIVAGICGYCVGNLHIPGSTLPWEKDSSWVYPPNLASPLKIIIDASDGASDYGNKFGEPVITGFFRVFGMETPDNNRIEWLKPIMFSAGVGTINDKQLEKVNLKKDSSGLLVAKIGGPVYKIGVGGGCASSLTHGENDASRDFNAVQRGDAEMQQKLHRVVRACTECDENPLLSIHDQGAGGNGNVLKEIVEPSGAVIYSKAFTLGDETVNTQELWTAEYQESDAILIEKKSLNQLQRICHRERCQLDVVGQINGSGKVVLSEQQILYEDAVPIAKESSSNTAVDSPPKRMRTHPDPTQQHPVDLDLDLVLGKMPQKIYDLVSVQRQLLKFDASKISFDDALLRVLRLPSVSSKRFLTNKVDRSVSGLIAQQQCVGPLHTPLADVAVTTLSHFTTCGTATAVGEQPIKMLVDERVGARMAVGEALTNLVFAAVSDIRDVKCSANWMWPAKLRGEGARLYNACESMCDVMKELGIAVDGGKDSLSMAAHLQEEVVKSPGSLVITLYAPCIDVTCTVTPNLKCPNEEGYLVYVPMSNCKPCLGGTALAQSYNQLGKEASDLDDSQLFIEAWKTTQELVKERSLLAGHDVSDGGLLAAVLEMAFAGNRGLELDIRDDNESELEFLFSESLGLILETNDLNSVMQRYENAGVKPVYIGKSIKQPKISVKYNGKLLLDRKPTQCLRDVWESSSFMLESFQCDEDCVSEERAWMQNCIDDPPYQVTFENLPLSLVGRDINVAILREEGSNGDREMAAAFHMAGFQAWDVTMQDLIDDVITLDRFRGLVFVGGFSYADVFGSAKGWASCCLYNARVRKQLEAFRSRKDVFSLGVCNGCQLMVLLGWVGAEQSPDNANWDEYTPPLFVAPNKSNRFESRFVTVEIKASNAIMLKDMEQSKLGVWVAHGEGNFRFSDDVLLKRIIDNNLSPMRYVDHSGHVTTQYPLNPNGSPHGMAGLCSEDGRHLAVMPHPERCVNFWQWPWMPHSWKSTVKDSPWLRMFQNALSWCLEN